MIKAIVLLKRKSDLSKAEFIEHYETRHVPLVRRLLPTIGGYSRNYLNLDESPKQHESVYEAGSTPDPYFDVITELWFDDQAAYDAFVGHLQDSDVSRQLQEDEARFLDRKVIQTFPVDERVSDA